LIYGLGVIEYIWENLEKVKSSVRLRSIRYCLSLKEIKIEKDLKIL